MNIFEYDFFYIAYANDTMFLLKNQKYVREVFKVSDRFLEVSGSKDNTLKCEVVGIGRLKGVNVALCGT